MTRPPKIEISLLIWLANPPIAAGDYNSGIKSIIQWANRLFYSFFEVQNFIFIFIPSQAIIQSSDLSYAILAFLKPVKKIYDQQYF
jgi:hypothetical protein